MKICISVVFFKFDGKKIRQELPLVPNQIKLQIVRTLETKFNSNQV